MIRNQWYVILESNEVGKKRPVGVTRLGEKMVLWRDSKGQLHCMGDQCPHMHAPLHRGRIKGNQIACPFHGFQYDASGQCVYLPAIGRNGKPPQVLNARVYPVHEAHGYIYIFWGDPAQVTPPPAFFDSIDEHRFHFTRFRQRWDTHYARMLENQLDVCHLPFVHFNTIGRGSRTVIEGPYVEVDGDMLNIWALNRKDDGTPVKLIGDLQKPDRRPSTQLRFANLWHNWIADDIRVLIAFVPVDDAHSIMYGRFYQRILRLPLLRNLMGLFGVIGSHVIANQDKRVVTRIVPKNPADTDDEHLRVSDYAVARYRKRKKELLEAVGK